MSSQNLIDRLLQSPLGKDIERKAEEERIAERRKCRERIDEAERKYNVLIEGLDPKIEAAERLSKELQEKLTAATEELTRLNIRKRFGYIDRDREVKIQEDRLRETIDPILKAATDGCYRKLMELGRKSVSGESRNKPNIWGVVTQALWSNARSVGARKTVIRKVLEKLQGMELKAIEDEPAEVKKLMDSIPRDPLESDYDEVSYEPEARRLTKYPARSTRV